MCGWCFVGRPNYDVWGRVWETFFKVLFSGFRSGGVYILFDDLAAPLSLLFQGRAQRKGKV